MTDNTLTVLVGAAVTLLTPLFVAVAQRLAQRPVLKAVGEVHTIVNSAATAMMKKVEKLEQEVARLSVAGAAPTPPVGTPGAPVMIDGTQVIVEKRSDLAPPTPPPESRTP